MTPAGFEPTFSAGKRPQNYALDRAATGTGIADLHCLNNEGEIYIYIYIYGGIQSNQ